MKTTWDRLIELLEAEASKLSGGISLEVIRGGDSDMVTVRRLLWDSEEASEQSGLRDLLEAGWSRRDLAEQDEQRIAGWLAAVLRAVPARDCAFLAVPELLSREELQSSDDFYAALTDWQLDYCAAAEDALDCLEDEERFDDALMRGNFLTVMDCVREDAALAGRRDDFGWTPLHEAGSNANSSMFGPGAGAKTVSILIEHGADPKARTDEGVQPIHVARAPAIPILVAAGADVEARDESGRSPLIAWACESGGVEEIRALLAAGARRSTRDDDGRTAADYASMRGEEDKLDLLREPSGPAA